MGAGIIPLLIVILIDFIVNLYKTGFLKNKCWDKYYRGTQNLHPDMKLQSLYVNKNIIHFGEELLWKHFLQYFFLKALRCLRCQALCKRDPGFNLPTIQ